MWDTLRIFFGLGAALGGTAAYILGTAINAYNNSNNSDDITKQLIDAERSLGYRLIPESFIAESTSPRHEVLRQAPEASQSQKAAYSGQMSSPELQSLISTGKWCLIVIWDVDGYLESRAYFERNGIVYYGNAYAAHGFVGV